MTDLPSVRVIILAQGQQRRLPALAVPKQLLRLRMCDTHTILDRTLFQLAVLLDAPIVEDFDSHVDTSSSRVTVVCEGALRDHLHGVAEQSLPVADQSILNARTRVWYETDRVLSIEHQTLPDPGNSSLKGISRALAAEGFWDNPRRPFDKTVVLLGDVVYSWACLRTCLTPQSAHNIAFVGTSDLDPGTGEVWGISWLAAADTTMQRTLESALTRHPPFVDYQPGQMRRWLWEIDGYLEPRFRNSAAFRTRRRTWFTPVDDYTRDIDIPKHVEQLGELSRLAAEDDEASGHLSWRKL
jgi:hypothetical protein